MTRSRRESKPAIARRLPSLRAILAFESTARNLSIAGAAGELNLTSSAVSHSIIGLESLLGAKLFRRKRDGVALTEAGRNILAEVRPALAHLDTAFAPPIGDRKRLAVTIHPSLATRWLLPRLPNLVASAPDIRFEILLTDELAEFEIDRAADVAIRFGPGGWPGLDAIRLLDEQVVPVASPNYRGGDLPKAPADLAQCALITNPWQPWAPWLAARGIVWDDARAAVAIHDSSMVIQAAVAGAGVALARALLAHADLEAGRLTPLFHDEALMDFAYWLAWPKNTRKLVLIETLLDWLKQEIA
jgi:LysR family glycine cleavage system transcriptional activator